MSMYNDIVSGEQGNTEKFEYNSLTVIVNVSPADDEQDARVPITVMAQQLGVNTQHCLRNCH